MAPLPLPPAAAHRPPHSRPVVQAVLLVGLVLGWGPGCRRTAEAPWTPTPTAQPEPAVAEALARGDQAWLGRGNPRVLYEALVAYQEAMAIDPHAHAVEARLVRGWSLLAETRRYRALTDETLPSEMQCLEEALRWGEQCRTHLERFVDLVQRGRGPDPNEVLRMARSHIPCLYWQARAREQWARARGPASWIRFADEIRATMERIREADPSHRHYGPDRFLGRYYATLPTYMGRDPDRARRHFERAITGAPDLFRNRLDLVAYLLLPQGKTEEAREQVDRVLGLPPDILENLVPEQILQRERARQLLERLPPAPP